jgi:glycosyltransferase involved in cell wall biosynthesis
MRRLAKAGAALASRRQWLWANRDSFGTRTIAEKRRLLVDVSAIIRHDARTGIQRVVRAVWSHLSDGCFDEFSVLPVYAAVDHGYCYAPPDFLGRKSLGPLGRPAAMAAGDKFLGLDLAAHLLPYYRTQLKAWKKYGATIHLLVYDLLPLFHPEWFKDTTVANFRRWYSLLASEADQAICISSEIAAQLRRQLHADGHHRPQIARMQLGADIAASLPSKGLSEEVSRLVERLRFRPAVLMVGTIEPRKGYDVALRTFEYLWRTRSADAPDLVIVGKGGWKTESLQAEIANHPEQGRRLRWLRSVSDEDLCRLYEACRGVFMPSRAEGFGLPLLEAAISQRYVLARSLAVFREQQLPNTIFFDDERPEAVAEKIMELVRLVSRAVPPTANLPMWNECIDRLLEQIGLPAARGITEKSELKKAS